MAIIPFHAEITKVAFLIGHEGGCMLEIILDFRINDSVSFVCWLSKLVGADNVR